MILYPIVLCEVERWRVLLDSEHSILYSKYVQVPNLPQSEEEQKGERGGARVWSVSRLPKLLRAIRPRPLPTLRRTISTESEA